MAVLYKSFQSVLEDKNHKKMFHPRVIYTANISTSQIAKEIAAYGRSVGCASFSYGPFPSQLHQEPRSDYRYPLFGDRCEVCALRPYRHSGFRQWKYK